MVDRKEYQNAALVGVIIMLAFIIYSITPFARSNAGRLIGGLEIIVFRVLACLWVFSLVKGLGRRPLGYVLAAILIPAIILIVVGSMADPQKSDDRPR